MGRISFREDGISESPDESYRTCGQCGADCVPEADGAPGMGVRLVWVCALHGPQGVWDPFSELR